MKTDWTVDMPVETIRDLWFIGGVRNAHVNYGKVERLTPSFIIVRNEHGNSTSTSL